IEADVGMMGGHGGEEFVAPSPNGEADLVRCSNCDYAANVEVARSLPRPPEFPPRLDAPEEVETPDATTIEALAEFLGIDPAAPAGTCAGSRRGATTSPSFTTCARSPRATSARSAATAPCTSNPRSRLGTSSSSAPATPCR